MPGLKKSAPPCDERTNDYIGQAWSGLKVAGLTLFRQGKELVLTDVPLPRVIAAAAVTGLAAVLAPGLLAIAGGIGIMHATCFGAEDLVEEEAPAPVPTKKAAAKKVRGVKAVPC